MKTTMRIRMSRENKFTWAWAVLMLYAPITLITTLTLARNVHQSLAILLAGLLIVFIGVLCQGFEVIKE